MKNTMKKNFLATLTFLFTTALLSAQTISTGFKGVWNFSNVKTPDIIANTDVIPTFKTIQTTGFGFVAEAAFSPRFALQSELNFVTKGFKIREQADLQLFEVPLPVGVTAVSKFRYVEVPLLAKVNLGTGPVRAYLLAGPTFGYATSGKLETRANFLIELDLYNTPIDLDQVGYKRWETGATAGGGLAFETGRGEIFLDARYTHGFTEVYDIPVVHERVQNRSFGLQAGYLFRF